MRVRMGVWCVWARGAAAHRTARLPATQTRGAGAHWRTGGAAGPGPQPQRAKKRKRGTERKDLCFGTGHVTRAGELHPRNIGPFLFGFPGAYSQAGDCKDLMIVSDQRAISISTRDRGNKHNMALSNLSSLAHQPPRIFSPKQSRKRPVLPGVSSLVRGAPLCSAAACSPASP